MFLALMRKGDDLYPSLSIVIRLMNGFGTHQRTILDILKTFYEMYRSD